jgi:hypothetical protein
MIFSYHGEGAGKDGGGAGMLDNRGAAKDNLSTWKKMHRKITIRHCICNTLT